MGQMVAIYGVLMEPPKGPEGAPRLPSLWETVVQGTEYILSEEKEIKEDDTMFSSMEESAMTELESNDNLP